MACTPQQIEEKRKLALQKLQSKKIKLSPQPTKHKQTIQTQLHVNRNLNNTNTYNLQQKNKQITTKTFFGTNVKAVFSLINENRFEVKMPYHSGAISVFQTISSRQYNGTTKTWNFAIEHHDDLFNKLNALQPEVLTEKLPKYVLNLLKSSSKSSTNNIDINLDRIENDLLITLMPFQKEGVRFGIKHKGRCLIADDMGLGKTLQALALASYYREDWPLLIVTTASMKNTWEETIHKYLPSVPLAYIRYMSSGKDYINDAEILIISHDMMTRCTDKLLEKGFKFLIIDESHVIKNHKAKCTKSAIILSRRMNRVVLLSGTPALSRPNELYCQLSTIDEKFFGNFFEYSKRYCDAKETNFGWDSSGKSNLTELEIILSKRFMIRRTKGEVLDALPDKNREVIKLNVGLNTLSESERTCLTQLVDNYVTKKAQDKYSALLTLFAESARIKIPSVWSLIFNPDPLTNYPDPLANFPDSLIKKFSTSSFFTPLKTFFKIFSVYIENILESGEKFLVFAHHQVMLDAICSILDKKRKKFIRIDGQTNGTRRKYFIDKFQLQDDCIAAVLSITAANAGITLTAAQLVIFAELHWNPSILSQAESRAHRIGQSNTVNVRYLLAEGTVDDHIWPMLLSKQNVLSEVGLNKETFEDTDVKEQFVGSTSGLNRTVVGTKDITDYFSKENSIRNNDSMDTTLQEFLEDDDNDDIFMNADVDF